MTNTQTPKLWLQGPLPAAKNAELQAELERIVQERKEQGSYSGGTYSEAEQEHIRQRKIFTQLELALPIEHLDSLRKLCQLWDVRFLPRSIQSHRKIIGPIIVWVKKSIFPLVEILLKDSLRQQREFNAAAIQALAEIAARKKS